MKATVNLSVYLILEKAGKILLGLRQNTGYEDGKWMLMAGHVEAGEQATYAMCREAMEEIGIEIRPEDLEVLHVMHRVSNRENIDIFMRINKWQGEIINQEPHKCEKLDFFAKDELPENIVEYIRVALRNIENGVLYAEYGWEEK